MQRWKVQRASLFCRLLRGWTVGMYFADCLVLRGLNDRTACGTPLSVGWPATSRKGQSRLSSVTLDLLKKAQRMNYQQWTVLRHWWKHLSGLADMSLLCLSSRGYVFKIKSAVWVWWEKSVPKDSAVLRICTEQEWKQRSINNTGWTCPLLLQPP